MAGGGGRGGPDQLGGNQSSLKVPLRLGLDREDFLSERPNTLEKGGQWGLVGGVVLGERRPRRPEFGAEIWEGEWGCSGDVVG